MIEKGQNNFSTVNEKSLLTGFAVRYRQKGTKYILQNSSSGWWWLFISLYNNRTKQLTFGSLWHTGGWWSSLEKDVCEGVDGQAHCIQVTAVPRACRHIQEPLPLRSEGFLVQDRPELSVAFIWLITVRSKTPLQRSSSEPIWIVNDKQKSNAKLKLLKT